VSFEVERGEMLAIVGENGAGKSTLLKLLSRIIEPSSGTITVNGRMSALLELGAGFHPDLTGRENIYLNGSVIGFKKAEMDRIFDSIVAFSEMERFIDVPVKHYSSGMYMRLGFSIAIHVEPDILLVDEVLAVGDQAFQLRCLDRINQMKRQGVTIILVSHSLKSVRDMCDRAIWLDEGQIRAQGAVEHVLEQYLSQVYSEDMRALLARESRRQDGAAFRRKQKARAQRRANAKGEFPPRWGSREAEITQVEILDTLGKERRTFRTGEPFTVRIHFHAAQRIEKPQFGIAIHHSKGFHVSGPNTVLAGLDLRAIEGEGFIDYVVDSLPLLEDTYLVSASIYDHEGAHAYDHHHQAYTFRVRADETLGETYGSVFIPSTWQTGPTGFLLGSQASEDES
jgi:lipopolysaccharide transport system ATP-binding protein